MTIQEAIADLRSGEDERIAECLDNGIWRFTASNAGDESHLLIPIKAILSTRWITRDAQ